MQFSLCPCCSKASVGSRQNIKNLVYIFEELFSEKLEGQQLHKALNICNTCYVRLKLACSYKNLFDELLKRLKSDDPLSNGTVHSNAVDVPVVYRCPVCMVVQPTAQHVNEHLYYVQRCRGCCTYFPNIQQHHFLSPQCSQHVQYPNEDHIVTIIHQCNVACGASFVRKGLLNQHQLQCEYVLRSAYADRDFLFYNTNQYYMGTPPVLNSLHAEPIMNNGSLIVNQQTQPSSFACETCGKSYTLRSSLAKHMKYHQKTADPALNNKNTNKGNQINDKDKSKHMQSFNFCGQCGKKIKSSELAMHNCLNGQSDATLPNVYYHHEVSRGEHSCNKCDSTFFTRVALRKHLKSVHPTNESCNCSVCGLYFSSAATLKLHERNHTEPFRKSYTCDVCNKQFCKKCSLTRHVRRQHGIGPSLIEKCLICYKMFPSTAALKLHMTKKHVWSL